VCSCPNTYPFVPHEHKHTHMHKITINSQIPQTTNNSTTQHKATLYNTIQDSTKQRTNNHSAVPDNSSSSPDGCPVSVCMFVVCDVVRESCACVCVCVWCARIHRQAHTGRTEHTGRGTRTRAHTPKSWRSCTQVHQTDHETCVLRECGSTRDCITHHTKQNQHTKQTNERSTRCMRVQRNQQTNNQHTNTQ